jgi:hypothetical protein
MFGDPSVADTVSSLDRGSLLRCYLVLLILSLLVLALRFAKWIEQYIRVMREAPKMKGVRSDLP